MSGKRAVIVAVSNVLNYRVTESVEELEVLCKTLNIDVVDKVVQRRNKPDPATYIGEGKLEKLKEFCIENSIDVIVVDDEITPVQQRNIEEFLRIVVLDRTQIILEIFSRHATTYEGKIQVEMAKLSYELPRLRGKGLFLSNPGGGIGTRGPGETILELDRRKIKERIVQLRRELARLKSNRENIRKARLESGYYMLSIVGYTNAGKSTLLSALAREDNILISDKLFSTLNPTVRKVKLPSGRNFLVSDTVGFINKLPHMLVEAFHSTLDEILYADLIIFLVDISDPFFKDKIYASCKVLEEIGAEEKERLMVFNKIDEVPSDVLETIRYEYPNAVFISAKYKLGFEELYRKIEQYLHSRDVQSKLKIKQEDFGLLSKYFDYISIDTLYSDGQYLEVYISGPESIVGKIKNVIEKH
ncbi:GTPase HflX [Fervidobacterium sp.]